MFELVVGDAGPAVIDFEEGRATFLAATHCDDAARRRIADRVIDQIG
jgi:hypothetical protein